MSESGVGVFTADNWEISVSLREDSNFNISVTEVQRNSNEGVVVIVDIFDLVGGPGGMDDVAVIDDGGGEIVTRTVVCEGIVGTTSGESSSAENLGQGVDEVNTSAGILLVEVGARIGGVVGRIVFPVDIRAHDSTMSQFLHQLSTAPFRFVGNAGKSGKAVNSFAGFGATTLVLQFVSGNGGSEKCQSRQKLSENHSFFGFIYSREADC